MKNNINISGLSEYVHEVLDCPTQAKVNYGVEVDWLSGTKTKATVKNMNLGDQKLVRNFTFEIDEPNQLLGLNTNPTPQEYLMAGVAGCMAVTFVAGATLLGITIESLKIEIEGQLDLCGFLGLESTQPTGFKEFTCNIHVNGNGTKEQYEVLRNRVMNHSPNFSSLVSGVKMNPEIIIKT
ncbi:MAG: OsmC family protein [Flavobacteriia bacterium]|nr:OsmC family protein [Flavobacteriia bacterium]